jgi:hypothetical protein
LVSGAGVQIALRATGLDSFGGLVDIVEGDVQVRSRRGAGAAEGFALVRPDGILAARGSRREAHQVVAYLRQMSTADAPVPAHS